MKKGLPIVGVPKTIDNDLSGTVVTFGFDTAVTVATEAIDRLHSTAEAHERVFVVEVMGRYAGWIALHSGVSATADVVLIPEIPFDIGAVCDKIMDREARGRRFSIVVVAEGAKPVGGQRVAKDQGAGREVLLGGIAEQVAEEIQRTNGQGDPDRGARPPPAGRWARRPSIACCRCGSGPRRCGWLRSRRSVSWWRSIRRPCLRCRSRWPPNA